MPVESVDQSETVFLTYRPIRGCVPDSVATQISHALDTQCNNEQPCCFWLKMFLKPPETGQVKQAI